MYFMETFEIPAGGKLLDFQIEEYAVDCFCNALFEDNKDMERQMQKLIDNGQRDNMLYASHFCKSEFNEYCGVGDLLEIRVGLRKLFEGISNKKELSEKKKRLNRQWLDNFMYDFNDGELLPI